MSAHAPPCNLSFFRLGSLWLSAPLFPSLKLTSHLHGWVAADGTIRTVVGSGLDVSSLHVVAPPAKWCGSCTGPQGARSHVQGTRGSSVYLWSHRDTDNCVCSPSGWSSFRTDAPLPRQNSVVPLILFPPPYWLRANNQIEAYVTHLGSIGCKHCQHIRYNLLDYI